MSTIFRDHDRVVYTGPAGYALNGCRVESGACGEVAARFTVRTGYVFVRFDVGAIASVPEVSLRPCVSLVKAAV